MVPQISVQCLIMSLESTEKGFHLSCLIIPYWLNNCLVLVFIFCFLEDNKFWVMGGNQLFYFPSLYFGPKSSYIPWKDYHWNTNAWIWFTRIRQPFLPASFEELFSIMFWSSFNIQPIEHSFHLRALALGQQWWDRVGGAGSFSGWGYLLLRCWSGGVLFLGFLFFQFFI